MTSDEKWHHETLQQLALANLVEQRRARRWQIFFRLAWLGLALFLVAAWVRPSSPATTGSHTALIDIDGVLQKEGEANADNIIQALDNAFEDSNTRGVILRINSPGGSPVQAGQVADALAQLKRGRPDLPVYTVVDDICASGGYYIAAATDKIYVNRASMVGSIGVVMEGFGFTGMLDKLGVERRVLTAGEHKAMLDPFRPVAPAHEAHLRQMLGQVHQQFITAVKQGRGSRLGNDPGVFSGLVYTGEDSVRLGLADGFGDIYLVARDHFKAENIVDYTHREGLAERLADRVGISMIQTLVTGPSPSRGALH